MVEARHGASAPDALLGDTGRSAIDGKTALMHAAIAGNLEMVRILKHKEARMQDRLGRTALMYAVKGERVDIVSELAQYEAGAVSRSGETALSMAIEQAFEAAVPALLPREIDVATDYCPNLIMHSARRRPPNVRILNSLVGYCVSHSTRRPLIPLRRPAEGFWRETALMHAAAAGDEALIEENLTQLGQMHRGDTALLRAVEGNRLEPHFNFKEI